MKWTTKDSIEFAIIVVAGFAVLLAVAIFLI